jgi:hypothetical protein
MDATRRRWVAYRDARARGLPTKPMGYAARLPSLTDQARVIVAEKKVALRSSSGQADRLVQLTDKSLDVVEDILDRKVSKRNPDLKLLSIKREAAMGVISTKVRVDEASWRREQYDKWPELLARVEAAKKGG